MSTSLFINTNKTMKVLVATDKPFAKIAVDGIRKEIEAAGYELALLEKYGEKAKLLEAVKDVDAIIIRSDVIDAEVLDAAKELKIVVRAGAGYDNVDLEAATAHNVCVMNTPGQNSNAVAELAFGLMVMAVRNMYNGASGTELKGKKLGIHAYGNVGRNVARIAKGFGMDIYAYDAYCPKEVIEADGVKAVASTEELYATCNIVSLHIPATPETKNSINYDLVDKMPKNGLLVNTARKEVINEADLLRLMNDRPDLEYVTDIMPVHHAEFADHFPGRYFSTPKKMGAQTAEANINAGIAAARQIVGFLKDGCEKFRVNKYFQAIFLIFHKIICPSSYDDTGSLFFYFPDCFHRCVDRSVFHAFINPGAHHAEGIRICRRGKKKASWFFIICFYHCF